jgi:hypothetical protein
MNMPGPFRNRGIAGLVPVAVSIVSSLPAAFAQWSNLFYLSAVVIN